MFIFNLNLSIYLLSFWYAWILFVLGLIGVIAYHRNLFFVLLNAELMLLGASFYFLVSSTVVGFLGHIYAINLLAIAAAESAIGLSLFTVVFGFYGNVSSDSLNKLFG